MSLRVDRGQRWLDDAPCAYLVTTVDGQVRWVNRTLVHWLGNSDLELVGHSLHEILTASGRIRFEAVTPSLTLNGHLRDVELAVRRADGTTLNLLCNATASPSADGEGTEVWWAGLDVSDRRAYEQDLLVAQRRLRRLQDLSAALVGATSVEEVADAMLGTLVDGVKADSGAFYVRDGAALRLVGTKTSSNKQQVAGDAGLDDEHVRVAHETGTDTFASDVEPVTSASPSTVQKRWHAAALPLHGNDSTVGVVRFGLARTRPHSEHERQLLRAAADMAGQALERVQLLDRHRRTAAENSAASALLHRMEEATTVAARAQLVADFLVPDYADMATVELPWAGSEPAGLRHRDRTAEPTLRWLRSNVQIGSDHNASLAAGRESRTPRVLNDVTPTMYDDFDLDEEQLEALRRIGPTAYLGVPLVARSGVIGSLMLSNSTAGREFSDADIDFVGRIAETCALAIENARLYEHERSIAQRLQTALLPESLPHDPRLQMSGFYEAGSEIGSVGGDWYDAFVLDGGDRIGLVVGDVVGGGIAAAAAMASLRVAVRAFALDGLGVVDVLNRLDRFAPTVDGAHASSVVYAELDLAAGRLTYASAGHLPLLLHHPGSPTEVLWDGRRPLLGIESGVVEAGEVTLRSGSSVVFYTDGLVERRGRDLDAGLADLARHLDRAPDVIGRPAKIAEIMGTRAHGDDTCILSVTMV